MSVVTLTLKYGYYAAPNPSPSHMQGWGIKITGLDISSKQEFIRNLKPPHDIREESVEGDTRLLITPCERQVFHNALHDDIPMEYVTKLLNLLAGLGYKVVGSHSAVRENCWATFIWTLQQ